MGRSKKRHDGGSERDSRRSQETCQGKLSDRYQRTQEISRANTSKHGRSSSGSWKVSDIDHRHGKPSDTEKHAKKEERPNYLSKGSDKQSKQSSSRERRSPSPRARKYGRAGGDSIDRRDYRANETINRKRHYRHGHESDSDTETIERPIQSPKRRHQDDTDVSERKEDKNKRQSRERKCLLKHRVHPVSQERVLLAMYPQETLVLRGKANLQCIKGSVYFLGFLLKSSSQQIPVYSPDSTSALTIKCVKHNEDSKSSDDDIGSELCLCESEVDKIKSFCAEYSQCCILALSKLTDKACDLVQEISSFESLFRIDRSEYTDSVLLEDVEMSISNASGANQGFQLLQEYSSLVKRLCKDIENGINPRVCVCGGKNVGKSTLGRYIINSLLNSCGQVAHLECDIGQTEFTPSGCVSLTLVDKPLFGPPFTHLQAPQSECFVGSLTPGDCPDHYIRCIQHVMQVYLALDPRPPLVINTMGWNRGLGIQFLADTLRISHPTHIIQLQSHIPHKNYPALTVDFTSSTPGWLLGPESEAEASEHRLEMIDSPVPSHMDQSRYKPVDHRDLALLSYISPLTSTPSLRNIQPYKVPWSAVAIHVCHTSVSNTQLMYAINASVVALCHVDPALMLVCEDPEMPKFLAETPVCECLGFGVVRSIDPVEKAVYLVTPVPLGQLQQRVNCLLRGALDLPQQLFMAQKSSRNIPYIDYPKDVVGATSLKRRKHMPRKRPSEPS